MVLGEKMAMRGQDCTPMTMKARDSGMVGDEEDSGCKELQCW